MVLWRIVEILSNSLKLSKGLTKKELVQYRSKVVKIFADELLKLEPTAAVAFTFASLPPRLLNQMSEIVKSETLPHLKAMQIECNKAMSTLLSSSNHDVSALYTVFGVEDLSTACDGNSLLKDYEDRFMLMAADSPLSNEIMAAQKALENYEHNDRVLPLMNHYRKKFFSQ